ncbi:MAG: methylmalonyl-CoA mutase [Candidatus Sericytochromatia bacterium]|nr:MAG: methylmalonyl-CoA mutase [Candidatus Sericytochromatia bacterium]
MDNIYSKFSFDEEAKLLYKDVTYDIDKDLGNPGEYPYTRGIHKNMYRGKIWTMRQYSGFGTAYETNKRFKYLLEQGQTGLSIAFDLPTQMGKDSDNPMSLGEVGKTGVAISSLADMEILLDGIPLDKVSTSMTINAPASILLAMYIAVAEKQGISPDKLNGTIQNDILKEYIARNTYIYPPSFSLKLIVDTFEYCSKNVPNWNTISISGYHIREAGANSIQEVAFTLANAKTYLKAAQNRNLDIDLIAPRLSFFFSASKELLEEVAKYRAARRLWAKIMKEEFKCKNPKSLLLRFHVQTAGSSLTAQQINNNIVRTTIEALAAVLGGAQSLHTNGHDEAISLPTEESARTALRIQQIIAYETDVAITPDPLGGSFFIEELTNKIENGVIEYFKKIDEQGGMLKCIEDGYIQREIQESAYKYQLEVENNQRIIVGVNKFQINEEEIKNIQKVSDDLEKKQIENLLKLKKSRNNDKVREKLYELERVAKSDENLFPYILDCVKVYATIGEICDVFRKIHGEFRPNLIL